MKKKEIYLLVVFISIILIIQGWSFLRSTGELYEEIKGFKEIQESSLLCHDGENSGDESGGEGYISYKANKEKIELLALELLGTATGDIKNPVAFIKDLRTGQENRYMKGSFAQKAKIIQISRGEVVLENNGRKEVLRMKVGNSSLAKTEAENSPVISEQGDSIIVSKRNLVKQSFRLAKALTKMKVKPHYKSGEVVGLKLNGIAQGSIIELAGIRNSDVITEVNGQEIKSYQKALQLARKIRSQPDIAVSLLRDGKPTVLSYRVK